MKKLFSRSFVLRISIFAFLALGVSFSALAGDVFLKIEGPEIKGEESAFESHKGEINVLAWSMGLSVPSVVSAVGGVEVGRVIYKALNVTKFVDKSSPFLMFNASKSDSFDKVTLTIRKKQEKTGIEPKINILIILENVFVTSVSTGGSNEDDKLVENISLIFTKIEFKYFTKNPDGTDLTLGYKWDLLTNQGIQIK